MKIGDYIRTNRGIYKIKNINENKTKWKYECLARDYAQDNDGSYTIVNFSNEMIIKSSPNIIDLIEVGDYVNGYKVKSIDKSWSEIMCKDELVCYIDEKKHQFVCEIETIVTKEAMASIEYKV